MKLKTILLGIACLTIGWLASTAERSAHAQVSPSSNLKVSDWVEMGEANGVQVWRFSDGTGHICFVTSSGGISCGR